MAEQGSNAAAKGRARAEQDEKKEAEHGGRQNHGQRGESFKRGEPAAAAQHEQRRERHGDGEENRRGDRGQTERECEGLPVHEVHFTGVRPAFGEFGLHGGEKGESRASLCTAARCLVLLTMTAPCSMGG